MNYAYQAAMHCEDCAGKAMDALRTAGKEDTRDTEDWPQPAVNGDESDSPDHCDTCGVFLENDLTPEGFDYLRQAIADDVVAGRADSVAITTWAPFYGVTTRDLFRHENLTTDDLPELAALAACFKPAAK